MRILIGGSGSTGSSLLKNILSRHPAIFAGNETSLFTKRELYLNFTKNKWRIMKSFPFSLRSYTYHMYNGIDLLHSEYGHDYNSINNLIKESLEFQDFADRYFDKGLERFERSHWLEKTPGNSCCFRFFLNNFDDAKIILIKREPLETIASMIRRGYDSLYACGIYLINNAAAMPMVHDKRFIMIAYEDLVKDPQATVKYVCENLKIRFDPEMLTAGNQYSITETKIDSWEFDELDVVKRKATINFETLSDHVKEEVMWSLDNLRISPAGQELFDIELHSFSELLNAMNYDIQTNRKISGARIRIIKQMKYDRLKRIMRCYNTGYKYPLAI